VRIILAKTAGFCMGVKRAMDKVLALSRGHDVPVYTFGPLIHNRQVIEMLEARGVCARTDFQPGSAGTVVLRTHGVPPDMVEGIRAAGLRVEDGTCPHVLRGQRSIARHAAEGYEVIIVGDRDHDEVIGLAGHARGQFSIIAGVDEARDVPLGRNVVVVAQTTFSQELFGRIVAALRARKPDVAVVDSICTATAERQAEARDLAARVDAMVVVGGYHSANTRRLAEVCRNADTPTFHVETAEELDAEALAGYATVGVTAGASTPSWITGSVIDRLRSVGVARSRAARLAGGLAAVVIDGNLYMAAGAAALTYAVTKLLGLELATPWQRVLLMVAAFGYIFSAYAVGRMVQSRSGDPGPTRRSSFHRKHATAMRAAGIVLSAGAVAALVPFGLVAVALLGASYVMAAAYGLLVSPRRRGRFGRLAAFVRNTPASKDLLAGIGWTAVTVFVPVVAAPHASVGAVAAVAAFVFGLAFIRSVMFDFADVTADRLLGRDTLPALVGVARARGTLAALAAALLAVLAAGSAAGALAGPRYWILLSPAYVLCYLLLFRKVRITASERLCALVVDGGMLLPGAVAFLHAVW